MKKTLLTLLAAAVSVGMLATQAKADTLWLQGSVTYDTGAIGSAKAVLHFFNNANVIDKATVMAISDGIFAGFAGSSADMAHPWTFNPSTATPALWSIGGYVFNLDTATIVSQTPTFLNVSGTGTVTGPGGFSASGTWNFTSTGPGSKGKFGFTASTAVPDGGSAVALLGLALTGIEAGRRLIRARKA